MRRDILAIIALLAILALMVGGVMIPPRERLIVHGYDGPVARITEIDDRYADDPMLTYRSIADNAAYVYPIAPDYLDLTTMCGLRLEIRSAPNVLSTTYIETIAVAVVDKVAKTNMTRNWDVQRVKCSMGATVRSYEGGVAKCGQTVFWVTLEDNADSIFSTLDEHYAFFVNIYNIDPAVIAGEMEVTPTATGDYVYESVPADPVPGWIIDSGYTGEVNNHRTVKFPITVLNAEPAVWGLARTEASAQFLIGFDVILFGYWEQTVDYREWRDPPIPDLLGDLIAFLTLFAWVVLGFAASILVLRYVPDMKMKILAIGIIWTVLIVIYGVNSVQIWMSGG